MASTVASRHRRPSGSVQVTRPYQRSPAGVEDQLPGRLPGQQGAVRLRRVTQRVRAADDRAQPPVREHPEQLGHRPVEPRPGPGSSAPARTR